MLSQEDKTKEEEHQTQTKRQKQKNLFFFGCFKSLQKRRR